uniref:hypothetical protein n=1 Tax=uncultured Caballeronia sp. TaxID=1827198 RepID=UPI0035CABC1A
LLEYNGPEVWIASHWNPSPFRRLIALCEEVSLRSAARILVVSQVLKDDLVARGFSPCLRLRKASADGRPKCQVLLLP